MKGRVVVVIIMLTSTLVRFASPSGPSRESQSAHPHVHLFCLFLSRFARAFYNDNGDKLTPSEQRTAEAASTHQGTSIDPIPLLHTRESPTLTHRRDECSNLARDSSFADAAPRSCVHLSIVTSLRGISSISQQHLSAASLSSISQQHLSASLSFRSSAASLMEQRASAGETLSLLNPMCTGECSSSSRLPSYLPLS